jgi:hypothetical protein
MSFGVTTDHWGIAADSGTGATVKCINSSSKPANTGADAQDSCGTYVGTTRFDSKTDYSCEYVVVSGVFDLSDYPLGKVVSGKIITSIGIVTSNTAFPKVTVSGRSTVALDSQTNKYSTPLGCEGTKCAQKFGATVGANTKLTGTSVSATVNYVTELDSLGAEAAANVDAGRVEATSDGVGVGGAVAFTVDSGWTKTAGGSHDMTNTGYATGSITVQKNIAKT